MNCEICRTVLSGVECHLPPVTKFKGRLCEKCLKEQVLLISPDGEDPFGNVDNHSALLQDFVVLVAEFQVKHRLEFNATMTFPVTFDAVMKIADPQYLKIYADVLSAGGIDPDGEDIF